MKVAAQVGQLTVLPLNFRVGGNTLLTLRAEEFVIHGSIRRPAGQAYSSCMNSSSIALVTSPFSHVISLRRIEIFLGGLRWNF